MAAKKTVLQQLSTVLGNAAKLLKGPYKVASAGVVTGVIGGLIKMTVLTETFPAPYDVVGNVIIFVAVLMVVADIAKGGLLD